MDYKQVAADILDALGGKENITAAAHCATRLRLVLEDESLLDQKALDQMDVVKGTFSIGGQYQIILGAGIVNNVYGEFAKLTGLGEMSTGDVKTAGAAKMNPLQRLVKALSDIFVPIIPAIVAGGLLMGINNVLTASNLFGPRSLVEMYPGIADWASIINLFANAPFVFLPILIGFSATRKFGGNPYLGAALAMIMVHPDLLNGYSYGQALVDGTVPTWQLFGFSIEKVGYQGTVLPVLAVSYILSVIEKNLRKVIPSYLDNLSTPLLSVLITGLLTFAVVGPVLRAAGNGLTDGLFWLYDTTGFIGGGIFGFFYSSIAITGMHHSFLAVDTQLLSDVAKTGGSFLLPIASMANIAQGAATLAVFLITRNSKTKSIASAAGISALLGITEPAMFGINLKLRYPFIAAMIGSGLASAYIAYAHVLSISMGPAALPGIIAIRPQSIADFCIGMGISFLVAFLITLLWGKRKNASVSGETSNEAADRP
ncbi:sucrose-specific PTS transporter subunit IIBC [Paenibacillus polymyxa]|uniref:sucrose-specific PTS transporter subunit IIBC n=1 Tax=Paenibacillus polymyxa TaxID=1406 RepID=UPI0004D5A4B0|nr:sucrose-specific PTS transporter subunit IIBC [Paenibacillus polymyxa]KEO76364.1 PTS system trehalose-specific transporter subunits IIBC [Paenibacillus polymyxa]MCH6190383.1 sucrose-specific PTS transporter subunit IIBC [Paenibacillus polymyxa]WRL59535.1 sucrose-specific PTS transporter subunit IIBC [Paenibacillus polymyxa]